jgi:hypothetical protein
VSDDEIAKMGLTVLQAIPDFAKFPDGVMEVCVAAFVFGYKIGHRQGCTDTVNDAEALKRAQQDYESWYRGTIHDGARH